MRISRKDLSDIVSAWCPVFYLNHSDVYGPCSFDFFIENSKLVHRTDSNEVIVLVERGLLRSEVLAEHSNRARPDRLWLALCESARRGQPGHIDDVPVYAHVKAIRKYTEGATEECYEALEITYITMFAHNGPYHVLGARVGAHDGDIEHITVRIDPHDYSLIGVWYNAHRNHDGSWVYADRVEMDGDCQRIVSYIARHGHGHYPEPRTIYRHFFLGNDVMKREKRWDPRRVILLPTWKDVGHETVELCMAASRGCQARTKLPYCAPLPHHRPSIVDTDPCAWLRFKGFYGEGNGAAAPVMQCWFLNAEPPCSRHPLLRLFCHFWPETASI